MLLALEFQNSVSILVQGQVGTAKLHLALLMSLSLSTSELLESLKIIPQHLPKVLALAVVRELMKSRSCDERLDSISPKI